MSGQVEDALTVLRQAAQYAIEEDVDQARVRDALDVLARELERLRDAVIEEAGETVIEIELRQAAEAERDRLAEALRQILGYAENNDEQRINDRFDAVHRIARAALAGKPAEGSGEETA